MTSTTTLDLWVPGKPVAAQRPRMTRRGRAYTPQPTIDAEFGIAALAMQQYGCAPVPGHQLWDDDQALLLMVDYSNDGQRIRLVPLPDRSKAMRGDVDNYVKTTMDGLQKSGAFRNDSQVVSLVADKWPDTYDIAAL